MRTSTQRPLPEADERSAAFWLAAADHVLSVAFCTRCTRSSMPPDVVCPHCGTTDPDLRFVPVNGNGTIRSWTVVRQSSMSGFEVPFVLIDVELDGADDVRLIGRLLDEPDVPLNVGDPVIVAFEDLTDEIAVPAWTLRQGR